MAGGAEAAGGARPGELHGKEHEKRFLVLSKVFTLRKSHHSSLPSPAIKATNGSLASSKEEEDSRLLGFSENQEITKKTEVLEDGVTVARGRESQEFGKDRYTRLACLLARLIDFSIFKRDNRDCPGGPEVRNPPSGAGDVGLIPGPGRFHVPQNI